MTPSPCPRSISALIASTLNSGASVLLGLVAVGTSGCLFGTTGDGCGDLEPTTTPVEISEWNVTMERYASIQSSAAEYGGEAWETRDEASRCLVACAYANGTTYALADYGYETLEIESCELTIPSMDGDGVLNCTATHTRTPVCVGGRRPLALAGEAGEAVTCRQDLLDGGAAMEQVSITAFVELVAQLRALRAPAELIQGCHAAAEDERRHVELLVGLGARAPSVAPDPAGPETSLVELALHNATEGCVTETWAALLAGYQAQHASTAAQQRAFAEIAKDEARHADLAWELHDWLCGRLSASERGRVEEARAQAIARLEATARAQALAVPPEVRRELGLPEPRVAAALACDFGRRLLAAA